MTLMTMTLMMMTPMMMTMTLMMKWPKARQGKYPGKQDDHDHPRSPLTLIHQRCIFGLNDSSAKFRLKNPDAAELSSSLW